MPYLDHRPSYMVHVKDISSLFDHRDSESLERFWKNLYFQQFLTWLTLLSHWLRKKLHFWLRKINLTAKLNLGLFFAVRIFFRSQVLFSQSGFIFAVKFYFRSQVLFSQSQIDCEIRYHQILLEKLKSYFSKKWI